MSDPRTLRLSLQNMSCASCVGRVERGLTRLPGVSDIRVNLANETAQAQIDAPERIAEIATTLQEIGYPARSRSVRLNISSMSCASCVGWFWWGAISTCPAASVPSCASAAMPASAALPIANRIIIVMPTSGVEPGGGRKTAPAASVKPMAAVQLLKIIWKRSR